MKSKAFIARGAMTTAVVAAIAAGAFAATAQAVRFRECICPDVYAPVTCSNGFTYSNACIAGCYGATGCVRGDVAWK